MADRPCLEICVDSPAGLAAAVGGGAERIELCAALALGGLTPGPGLMDLAASAPVPVHAMIRPRPGDFVLSADDLGAMRADIAAARAARLAGVVIGASEADGRLDTEALAALVAAAGPMQVTLHRAFDLAPDPDEALEAAAGLGIRRILTSGGARSAGEGAAAIARLVVAARGRIEIMAGGGVTPENAAALVATGADALHASCSAEVAESQPLDRIGIGPRRETEASRVRTLKAAIGAAADNRSPTTCA